jgi:hypothetical protein
MTREKVSEYSAKTGFGARSHQQTFLMTQAAQQSDWSLNQRGLALHHHLGRRPHIQQVVVAECLPDGKLLCLTDLNCTVLP